MTGITLEFILCGLGVGQSTAVIAVHRGIDAAVEISSQPRCIPE